jgi:hypothetical protein
MEVDDRLAAVLDYLSKVHIHHFSLSLGVFWDFPIVARNGSLFALFG